MNDVWPSLARQWRLLGPPLRPSPEDVADVERIARESGARRALLLGVTPEIATCAWPEGASLVAVDASAEMIAQVWPAASVREGARAVHADWRAMPLGDGAIDLAVGDGVFTVIDHPAGARALFAEVARVLDADGRFAVRAFVAPEVREDPRAVVADLRAGRVASFHAFKWRLLMALQPSAEAGVRLADAWRAWRALVPDPRDAIAARGWPDEVLATIDAYRDSRASYVFATQGELAAVARDRFDLVATHAHAYELGQRCPTLVFTKRRTR